MKNVLAIGASNSSKSINKVLATYIANKIQGADVTVLEWNNIALPLYSADLEIEEGVPANAHKFKQLIDNSDAIVISLAEHNGLLTAAFKNLWDWTSRIEKNLWANKSIFLAATSPGGRGGKNVLRVVSELMPHFGGKVITSFSLPLFYQNFQDGEIVNAELKQDLLNKIKHFEQSI
jgi:NAD(P)H-dependent FMN reductase